MNVLTGQLPSLLRGHSSVIGNGTANGTDFVDTLLASAGKASPLMQAVVFIYRLLEKRFGLDPSLLLTVLGFAWGITKMASQISTAISVFVDAHLRSSISISGNDSIFEHLMKWMSLQPSIMNDRYLMAQTEYRSAWEEEHDLMGALSWTNGGDIDGIHKYLNFSNQAARSGPRYVPAMGSTNFWHNGTYFRLSRTKESLMSMNGWGTMKDVEEIKLSCYGRSVRPIKQLLADAKKLYYEDTHQRTTIYRPRAKEFRRDYNMWQQVARRPVRPMRTVVLDPAEKREVLTDINEYLHPATPNWYASRGIPLRRGYLFHGPPGTGKTSFSFALAGVFGIDIYVISLQDVNVTEEDLAALFAKLPRRCIVLLEDIDSAGLKRTEDQAKALEESTAVGEQQKVDQEQKNVAEDEKSSAKAEAVENDKDAAATGEEAKGEKLVNGDVQKSEKRKSKKSKKKAGKGKKSAKEDTDSDSSDSSSSSSSSSEDEEPKKRKKKSKAKGKSRHNEDGKMRKKRYERAPGMRGGPGVTSISMESISLSGLLNAIDGVASHEGRVLIMTTNKPESLDEALVRPGRVDMQVGFTNASALQAVELFHRMYEALSPPAMSTPSASSSNDVTAPRVEKVGSEEDEESDHVTPSELRKIAQKFGDMVPETMFSPAEIQGFLLKRKKSPRKALADAPGWIEGIVKQKEAKSKVTTVQ